MQVGATDTGSEYLYKHVICTDLGEGYVLEPEAGLGFGFD